MAGRPLSERLRAQRERGAIREWFGSRRSAGRSLETDLAKLLAHAISEFEVAVENRAAAPEGPILAEARRLVSVARDEVMRRAADITRHAIGTFAFAMSTKEDS